MSTVEERLASLEARMDAMTELRALMVDMRNDMTRQFAEMRADMSEFRADTSRQFTELRGDMNARFDQLNRRVDSVDDKHDRHFTWLVGLQMAIMLSVIGALLGTYFR